MYKLYNGDCLEIMDKLIEKGIKVDLILTDPPYGTTRCKWDSVIPFDAMWERLDKLIKDNGAILLFGSEPFSSSLICSNIKNFKYRINWNKVVPGGFLNANKMPLKVVEDICVFYKAIPVYNPQMKKREQKEFEFYNKKSSKAYKIEKVNLQDTTYGKHKTSIYRNKKKYPTTLLNFNARMKETNPVNRLHPTQKPVDLLEYLIKTYTNEGDIVLDFTMGSGSTGVACKNLNRNFIGIELDEKYFNIAKERIENI